ncbi:(Fe-S)-binding protein [Marinitoga litoralis]|uniref:(Fe-S)-binding protein n=1 Tax=Marinitoga litoralis TaxID=570855 RepID=UPI001960FF21|nr:(Fe-S)-binding protein [Marinitoga litoralis]MBM7559840.1 electron transport complex protein RnfB [Marinitoga litoralis]
MSIIINAVILLAILGFLAGTFLAFAEKKFEVKEDVRVIFAENLLPGINCGACGYPGCPGFAKGFVKGEVKADGCLPGKRQGVPEKLTKLSKMSDDELNKIWEEIDEDVEKIKEKF